MIRRSRVGCADTITFTDVDDFPAVINSVAPARELAPNATVVGAQGEARPARPHVLCVPYIVPTPTAAKRSLCVITGKPARYRDPNTGQPYHDLAAFKQLQVRTQQRLEQAQARREARRQAKLAGGSGSGSGSGSGAAAAADSDGSGTDGSSVDSGSRSDEDSGAGASGSGEDDNGYGSDDGASEPGGYDDGGRGAFMDDDL